MDTKDVNKVLANKIPKHTKKMINHDQTGSIPWIQNGLNTCNSIYMVQHKNGLKNRNHMIISKDTKKTSSRVQHSFIIKALKKLGIKVKVSLE